MWNISLPLLPVTDLSDLGRLDHLLLPPVKAEWRRSQKNKKSKFYQSVASNIMMVENAGIFILDQECKMFLVWWPASQMSQVISCGLAAHLANNILDTVSPKCTFPATT